MTHKRAPVFSRIFPVRRLCGDRRGISAVEFAFVLPLLVLIYVAGYQLSDAISAYRKVTIATRAIADLTTQYTSVADTDLDTVLSASQQIMTPYSADNAVSVVSEISVDASGNATVTWSRARPTTATAQTVGAPYTLPSDIDQPNTSLIVASMTYDYVPRVAATIIGRIPMHEQIIMSPRRSPSIPKS